MNEFEQNIIERAREWYYARKAVADGAPIDWTDFNADYLEEAVEEMVQSEEQEELLLVFICF